MIQSLPPQIMIADSELFGTACFSITVSGKSSKLPRTARPFFRWSLPCLKSLYHALESSDIKSLLQCFVLWWLLCFFCCCLCFFLFCCCLFCFWDFISYLKFSMPVNILCSLSVQDKFCFISHSDQMVLHSLTQQPVDRKYSRRTLNEWSPKTKICKYGTYTSILSSVPQYWLHCVKKMF